MALEDTNTHICLTFKGFKSATQNNPEIVENMNLKLNMHLYGHSYIDVCDLMHEWLHVAIWD